MAKKDDTKIEDLQSWEPDDEIENSVEDDTLNVDSVSVDSDPVLVLKDLVAQLQTLNTKFDQTFNDHSLVRGHFVRNRRSLTKRSN